MARRAPTERTWGVTLDGVPVGAIAYRPVTERSGMFHGICFTARVCGTGVAREAVSRVLEVLWADGVERLVAAFVADNTRVARFLAKLGASPAGVLSGHTCRGGVPLDLTVLTFVNPSATRRKADAHAWD
jgi:RimJ/RimL family protein N-acetyltransferase